MTYTVATFSSTARSTAGLEAEAILSRTRDIEADEPPIIETFRVFAYR